MKLLAITDTHPTGQLPIGGYWREQAACRDEDPELFFPLSTNHPQEAKAKAVCRRCPAATDCLIWAMSGSQQSGVWGGLSEDERSALKGRPSKNRQLLCKGCKTTFVGTSDRVYCSRTCSLDTKRRQAREHSRKLYPLSRIA